MKDNKVKKKKKRSFAFTLIELLAVIIILGILMIIAVPAVTKYINDSRKNSYISSAKSIISGTSKIANSEALNMTNQDITYYIPAKYIDTNNNHKTPYGEFKEAYVGVVTDGNSYNYYWISNDTSKQGIKAITEKDKLDIDLIEGNILDSEIREIVETTGIEDRQKIRILNLDGTWEDERTATKNLNEDGEIEPADTLFAMFVPGPDFNVKVKRMTGLNDVNAGTKENSILYIKRAIEEPGIEHKQETNIVSTQNSEVPIYAWIDNGTLYWWSEDIKPNLNIDSTSMFKNFQGVKEIELKYIKTDVTTDMTTLFTSCANLESLDVSKFDTRNVTNMDLMFYGTSNLKRIKGINDLNTSNVTSMKSMFYNMGALEELDVSKFDTSKVTAMDFMFYGTKKLKKLDVSHFNTSNVTNMKSMFYNMELLEELDVSKFDTSKVTAMDFMFYGTKKIRELDVSHFNTSNVTSMRAMFNSMELLEQLDVSSFDTSNVTDIGLMFSNLAKITSLNLSNFNTSNVIYMGALFQNMLAIEEIDVSNFDTKNVVDMSFMFGCGGSPSYKCKLSSIVGLNKFDTRNVTNMKAMFVNQQKLRTLDLSSFSTPKLKDTFGMFCATNLTTIYATPNFVVSAVTSSDYMFSKSSNGISASTDYVLTGGAGTTYDENHVDKEYARVDDPTNGRPGYFTLKTN